MRHPRFSAATDVGLQRNNNEDCYLSNPGLGLWIVADGMGGHAAGEVASSIATKTIQQEIHAGETLVSAIQKSHHAVLTAAANGHGGQGMGSTVVALKTKKHQFEVAWVGDSRAYLWPSTSDNAQLESLTTDHSYVQMLFQSGAISEDELDTHPEKNIITQCLGSVELDKVSVDHLEQTWGPGDWLLLCSDGLTDAVPTEMIESVLKQASSVQQATTTLIDAALNYGGRDNITVTVVEYPRSLGDMLYSLVQSIRYFFRASTSKP